MASRFSAARRLAYVGCAIFFSTASEDRQRLFVLRVDTPPVRCYRPSRPTGKFATQGKDDPCS